MRHEGNNPRPHIGLHMTSADGRRFSFATGHSKEDPRTKAKAKAREIGMTGRIKLHVVFWEFVNLRWWEHPALTPRKAQEYRTEITV